MQYENYPLFGEKHPRRFQSTWFKMFPSWLEYSPTDTTYCLPCYVFCKKPSGRLRSNVFTREGFRAWKKVNSRKNCAFLNHIGDNPCSPHNNAMKYCQLVFFRVHDEGPESKNRGNFLEMIKLLASYNDKKAQHGLGVSNIHGQGYDGVSLLLNDNPYAYCVHCCAHRLQLALVPASREVIPIHQFFSNLIFIVNIVCSSSKCHDEFQALKLDEIAQLMKYGDLETRKGKNQMGTLKRVGDTRWCSHLNSLICSLMKLGDVDAAYNILSSSEFILLSNIMKEIMGITYCLCQALQLLSQDILYVIFMKNVKSFCEQHDIDILDFSATYIARHGHSRHQKDHITIEHHFGVKIFLIIMDKQLQDYLDLNLSTMLELCQSLAKTRKSSTYYLIDKLFFFILTLPVSITTIERLFSTMKIIKTRLRNKMEDEFLADNMIIYIEKK
ncbi:hypothetical protein JHK84_050311 [Glycine max]|uniref:TTF-type domain-containing protein n=1 Tax=Glycine max TaxID=3847 RepID=A0A0R0F047_SOYBN|nr:hypothetical protein JHK86_050250 [Glycine max]KAG5094723.1 hypothetical protein JHK84_050311 [Glycine max]KAH1154576.1 hypothetical protein GYH30_050023 [Glycine max]